MPSYQMTTNSIDNVTTQLACRQYAVRTGWSAGVELLLDHGASALSRTPAQDVALHWAAFSGHVGILQQLVNAGGDVNAMGDVGNRPIHLAAAADQLEVRAHTCSTWAKALHRTCVTHYY